MASEKKSVLIVLDGWGHRLEKQDNAIAQAHTPFYDSILNKHAFALLDASEGPVGLPSGVMGNSEVGHMHIGCGRRVVQDQVRVYDAINDGRFETNKDLQEAILVAGQGQKNIHLLGLVSNGGVHSAQEHYLFLLDVLARSGFDMRRCFIHAILDGRDTPPKSAKAFLQKLQTKLDETGARLASVSGRFYSMDRDKRWDRSQKAIDCFLGGQGHKAENGLDALEQAYRRGQSDEFVEPTVICEASHPIGSMMQDDVVICFNFRSDRMRQVVGAFLGHEPEVLPIKTNFYVVTLTDYDQRFECPVLFPKENLSMSLGEVLARSQKKQFRIAETEKYAHVTFFLNGGREKPFLNESRLMIPSPKVSTYDQTPAMSSQQVTQGLVKEIESQAQDFLVVNYAQPDMVGHTGNWEAALKAVGATDIALQAVCETAWARGYDVFLTADHGNVEMMRDAQTKELHTSHTLSKVPFFLMPADGHRSSLHQSGDLSQIAPTILQSMGIPKPLVMASKSLFKP